MARKSMEGEQLLGAVSSDGTLHAGLRLQPGTQEKNSQRLGLSGILTTLNPRLRGLQPNWAETVGITAENLSPNKTVAMHGFLGKLRLAHFRRCENLKAFQIQHIAVPYARPLGRRRHSQSTPAHYPPLFLHMKFNLGTK